MLEPKKLLIIGGKGNGTVIASAIEDDIEQYPEWNLAGFLNDDTENYIGSYPILGKIKDAYLFEDYYFIYALTTVKKAYERIEILYSLGIPIERFATYIHPTAVVPKNVRLGYGVILMPGAIISADATIGNHVQMYANSFVGHDSVIGSYTFIANNASIGGLVTIGQGVHIGSNCSIRERVTLGDWSIVGLGSVVLKDVEPYTIVAGNPARVIGKIKAI